MIFSITLQVGHQNQYKPSAQIVDRVLVQEIYGALEANGDLPGYWRDVKRTKFTKIFGKAPGAE